MSESISKWTNIKKWPKYEPRSCAVSWGKGTKILWVSKNISDAITLLMCYIHDKQSSNPMVKLQQSSIHKIKSKNLSNESKLDYVWYVVFLLFVFCCCSNG